MSFRRFAPALLAVPCLLHAAAPPPAADEGRIEVPQGVKERCDAFFHLVGESKVEEAFSLLFKGSALQGASADTIDLPATIDKVKQALMKTGRLYGYDVFYTHSVGQHYVKIRCMALHEKLPAEWDFTFYQSPTAGWILQAFNMKDLDIQD